MFVHLGIFLVVCNFIAGEALNQMYFPVLIPVGVIWNILSFVVSHDCFCYVFSC